MDYFPKSFRPIAWDSPQTFDHVFLFTDEFISLDCWKSWHLSARFYRVFNDECTIFLVGCIVSSSNIPVLWRFHLKPTWLNCMMECLEPQGCLNCCFSYSWHFLLSTNFFKTINDWKVDNTFCEFCGWNKVICLIECIPILNKY